MHLGIQVSSCQHVEEVRVLQSGQEQGQMHGCEWVGMGAWGGGHHPFVDRSISHFYVTCFKIFNSCGLLSLLCSLFVAMGVLNEIQL